MRRAGSAEMTLADFKAATITACKLESPEEARTKYPNVLISSLRGGKKEK
jgi:hypothetical protein